MSGVQCGLVPPLLTRQVGFAGCFWAYSACSLVMSGYACLVIPDNRGLSLVKIGRVNKYPYQAGQFFNSFLVVEKFKQIS